MMYVYQRIQAAQDRQKSYADLKRKPMEFEVGDRVMLKVSPLKGVARFGKRDEPVIHAVGRKSVEISPVYGRALLISVKREFKTIKASRYHWYTVAGTLGEVLSSPGNVKIHSNRNTHSFSQTGLRHPLQAVMSSASSAVTYTSVYTDSEPGRVFWGVDEELSDAPPLPDYRPGPKEPQTPPVPQDEDEREPMFILPHDPDYVQEPMYPEYIPLEDEKVFPAKEQPLPLVVSPTAESPGYVTKSDPEEDPEEYEDDETEDGPVDYLMDGGEDGDDDDGDSSGDNTDNQDEDEEDEEEVEKHLAPADSAVVVPTVKLVSPPEGTGSVTPPPSTDVTTTGARITVQASGFHIPSTRGRGERHARCTVPSAHSSPPPVPSLLLPSSGCLTQIQTLKIASTQALVNAVTAALPSPPLPPLPPSLYVPPPIDRKDDIPESELPPRKRSCLSTLGPRYEVGESSTARPTGGRGIDYGFVSTVDVEARRRGIREVGYGIRDTWVDPAAAVPKIAPMTVGEVNTRVTELAELHVTPPMNFICSY
ncbi:hypothetical protein Tco_0627838 [Tanacetum coccineum]|uniref:Reverse transcriptase domain-containing protein n=1 Tax=Tanacetum coccineum TaxID=301880 RepID=A0ABQ4WNK6_9ASTR